MKMRDWGYDSSPEDVAEYSKRDSLDLSKVDEGDLIDELEVRLHQYDTLPAAALCENIEGVIAKYKEGKNGR
jgi:hypothetical protein